MIAVNGLSDSIFEAMLAYSQNNVVESILQAASYGQTSCIVNRKGVTPTFLSQLEMEGVSHIEQENSKIKLFWEW